MGRTFISRPLRQVAEDLVLYAKCLRCSRARLLDTDTLIARFGPHTSLSSLTSKLRCRGCGSRHCSFRQQHKSRAGRSYPPAPDLHPDFR